MPDLLRVKETWWKSLFGLGFHIFDLVAYDVLYRFSPASKLMFFNGGYLPIAEDFVKNDAYLDEEANAMMYHIVCKPLAASKPKRILDVGCGLGGGLFYIANFFKGIDLVGIDRNRRAVSLSNRRMRDYPNVKALRSSGDYLDFEDNSFDGLTSVGVVTYFGLTQFTKEALRVVKPGAFIAFSGGYRQGDHDKIKAELRAACKGLGKLVSYENTTPNIFECLKADIPRREALLKRVPWPFSLYGRKWADLPGSAEYEEYERGLRADFLVVMQKI